MRRGMIMKLFDINLNRVLKIRTFGKETLIPPRLHVSRTVTEYIIYVITDGELHLVQNGEELILMPAMCFSLIKETYTVHRRVHIVSIIIFILIPIRLTRSKRAVKNTKK